MAPLSASSPEFARNEGYDPCDFVSGQSECTMAFNATHVCATKGFRYRRSRFGIFSRMMRSQVCRTESCSELVASETLLAGIGTDFREVRGNKSAEDISISPSHKQVSGNAVVMLTRRMGDAVFQDAAELNF